MQIVQLCNAVTVMEKKKQVINIDSLEITHINTVSLVKMFTGIISGIAIILSLCSLFLYFFIIRGNMLFLQTMYGGYVQYFDIDTIILWLGAVIVISGIIGLFLVGVYDLIAPKTGGIILLMEK